MVTFKKILIFITVIGFLPNNLFAVDSVIFQNDGKVGVGTTLPTEKLTVEGNIRISKAGGGIVFPDGTVMNSAVQDSARYSTVNIGAGGAYKNFLISHTGSLSGYNESVALFPKTMPGQGEAKHLSHFKSPSHANGRTSHVVAVDDRLGVGTIYPKGVLEVFGESPSWHNAGGIPSASIRLFMPSSDKNTGASILFSQYYKDKNTYPSAMIHTKREVGATDGAGYGRTSLVFSNWGGNESEKRYRINERMRIDSYGRVGIGTTSPTEQLTVEGNIRISKADAGIVFSDGTTQTTAASAASLGPIKISEDGKQVAIGTDVFSSGIALSVNGAIKARDIAISQSGWADYVFDSDYELMPLPEVEQFVKQNNHLPGIPSEKEVLKNGILQGEFNVQLLKKVEELTLYVIELEKRITALENAE